MASTPASRARPISFFVHFGQAQPGGDAGAFAGAQAVHQLVPGAQQVLHVENHEVIAGGGDHFAEQGRGDRIEQAEDFVALAQPGEHMGLSDHDSICVCILVLMRIVIALIGRSQAFGSVFRTSR
ncbi:hypothetical protein ACFS3C_04165 [Azotobacter vinelandii]